MGLEDPRSSDWDPELKQRLIGVLRGKEGIQVADPEAYLELIDPDTLDFKDRDNLPVGTPVYWSYHDGNQCMPATILNALDTFDPIRGRSYHVRCAPSNTLYYMDGAAHQTVSMMLFPYLNTHVILGTDSLTKKRKQAMIARLRKQ